MEATPVGEFTDNGRLKIKFGGDVVADMELDFLFGDVSTAERVAKWKKEICVDSFNSPIP